MLCIGIDVGGTRTKVGAVDTLSGKVAALEIAPTIKDDAHAFMLAIGSTIEKLQQRLAPATFVALGIGVPGYIESGVVDTTWGFLPFMDTGCFNLCQALHAATGLPCFGDNDARLVALGEACFGAGAGHRRLLALTLGTGLGVGFVSDQGFLEAQPRTHMAGHIRLRLDDAASSSCICGQSGCAEARLCAAGLLTNARGKFVSPEALFTAAQSQSHAAAGAIERYLADLELVVHNFALVYAPDRVVVGGGLALGLQALGVQPRTNVRSFTSHRPSVAFAALGDGAGVVGAAVYAAKAMLGAAI
ncbi:MAG: ROK family protein [Deltaproteobacteria bacterium]|nr:ROK family protein [Deltaproteobacteria bacterium]